MGFHFNIRFILVIYYSNAFIQSVLYTITQVRESHNSTALSNYGSSGIIPSATVRPRCGSVPQK